MSYIHIYKNSPTAGGTDGTQVSEGDSSNPITTPILNANNNDVSTAITLSLRCDTGYNTQGNTTITPTGTNASKWSLSLDGTAWGAYGAALTISTVIGVVNTLFYAKAKAISGETPVADTTVYLQTTGYAVSV